jgi:hypothetical protein
VFDGGDEGGGIDMVCRVCKRDVIFIKQGKSRVTAIHKGDTMPAGAVPVSGLTAERTEHYARKRLEEVCQGVKE